MDPAVAEEARAWARKYVAIVERFDLCPWAAPARARGEVWIGAADEDDVTAALEAFERAPGAVVGLCVLPGFTGDLAALRRLRNRLCESPIGQRLALAEFHPVAPLDDASAARLVPFLRRSPDPMLQAVRHATMASFRRGGTRLASIDQLSLMSGKAIPAPRDVADDVADNNLATLQRDRAALAGALDELVSARAAARSRSG